MADKPLETLVTTNLKKLYDAVGADYDLGDWDNFTKKMSSPDDRKVFYDKVGGEYDLGSFEEFEGRIQPEINDIGTPWRKGIFESIPQAVAGGVRSVGAALESNFPTGEFVPYAPGPSRLLNIPGSELKGRAEQTAQAIEAGSKVAAEAVGVREATGPRYVNRTELSRFTDPAYAYKAFAENLPLTGALALSRGSMVPMTIIEAGDALQGLRERAKQTGQSLTPEQETILSGTVGLINGKLEQLGIESMFKGIRAAGFKGLVKDAVVAMFSEGPTEGLQQLDQSLAVAVQDGYMSEDEAVGIISSITATLSDPKTWNDVSEASFGGFITGPTVSVAGAPFKRTEEQAKPSVVEKVNNKVAPINQATATMELEDIRRNAPDNLKEIFDEAAEREMDEVSEAEAKATERRKAEKARKQAAKKAGAAGTAEGATPEGTATGKAGTPLPGEGADSGIRGDVAEQMNPQTGGQAEIAEEAVPETPEPKQTVMDKQQYRVTQAKRELSEIPSDNPRKRNEGVREVSRRAVDPNRAKAGTLTARLKELTDIQDAIYDHLFPENSPTQSQFDNFKRDTKDISDEITRLETLQQERNQRRQELRSTVDKIFAKVEGPEDTAEAIKEALRLEEEAEQIDLEAFRGKSTVKVYHGSPIPGITETNPESFFTDDPELASMFKGRGETPSSYEANLDISGFASDREVRQVLEEKDVMYNTKTAAMINGVLRDKGFKGLIRKIEVEDEDGNITRSFNEYVAFDPIRVRPSMAFRGKSEGDVNTLTVPVKAKQVATSEGYRNVLNALKAIFPEMSVEHYEALLDVDPETMEVIGNILGGYKNGKVWVAGTKKGNYVEFDQLEADTLSHEAFHYWWRLVADKSMKDMAEKVFGDSTYNDVTYKDPEEAMAEAIKDYLRGRLAGPRSLRTKVRDYLQYVVARIKEFFNKGSKDDILRILTNELVKGGPAKFETFDERLAKREADKAEKAKPAAQVAPKPKPKKRKQKVTFSKSVLKEDRKLWDRFVDTFSTTNRYERLSAPNTAKAIKGFYGNIDQIADKLKTKVAEMAKLANYDMSLLRDAILSRDSRKYRASLPEERKERIRELMTHLDAFYDEIFEQYKAMGILKEKFHEKRLREALAKLKRVRSDKSRAVILKDIEAIVDSGYVPIPYKVWFRKLSKKGRLTEGAVEAFVSFAGAKGRETIRIADLIEAGVVKREDIDWSTIMSDYIYRVSRDFAKMEVIEAAKKDKLVVSPSGAIPWNFVRLPVNAEHMNPKIVYAHPSVIEFWNDINAWHVSALPYKFLAMTKMMQFVEPYILAMYNIAQTAIVTGPWTVARPDRSMAAFVKAAKMMKEQDEEYQAIITTLSSTPYANPVESLYRDVDRASRGNLVVGPLKSYVHEVIDNKILAPWITIRSLYEASWTVAWAGDRFLRLYTYNMLRSSGMSMEDAASLAAQASGDYAAVPGKTRKFLNTILFTPTFQIAMGKFWFKMIKEAVRMPLQLVGGPKLTHYERRLAMSAYTVVAINVGFHMLMTSLGFEPDETGARVFGVNVKKWFLTYRKTVETDNGKREVVITVSNPVNFPAKYFYRFMETFSPAESKPVMRLLRVHAWQLHPVLRVATQIATQTKLNGQPLVAPNESTGRIILENTKFAGTELVRAFKPLSDQDDFDKSDEVAGRELRKELGWTFDILTAAWATRYVRQPIKQRFLRQAQTLAEEWRSYYYRRAMYEFGMGTEYNIDMEALKRQEANLRKKIDQLAKFADELDKEEKSGK